MIKEKNFFDRAEMALDSPYFVPVALVYGIFCWFFKAPLVAVGGYFAAFMLILLLCKNVRNIFSLVFYVSFFITDIAIEADWAFYGTVIGIAAVTLVLVLAVRSKRNPEPVKKGRLLFPFVLFSAALALGGVIGRFNPLAFVIIVGFCVVDYVLYYIALNFTQDLGKRLAFMFIIGAAVLSLQVFLDVAGAVDYRPFETGGFLSAQTENTTAIFIALGIAGCFYFGYGQRRDALFFVLSVVFAVMTVATRCRMMIAVAAVMEIFLFVAFIVKSDKKTRFLYALLVIAATTALLFCFYNVLLKPFFDLLAQKLAMSSSGRDTLFPWCFEKFAEYPLFGYGFPTEEVIPNVRGIIVLAHNSLLQWLCSLGLVGTTMTIWFYITKYKTVFDKHNDERLFTALAVLCVACSGIMDQAATMDFFVALLPLILVASAEKNIDKK